MLPICCALPVLVQLRPLQTTEHRMGMVLLLMQQRVGSRKQQQRAAFAAAVSCPAGGVRSRRRAAMLRVVKKHRRQQAAKASGRQGDGFKNCGATVCRLHVTEEDNSHDAIAAGVRLSNTESRQHLLRTKSYAALRVHYTRHARPCARVAIRTRSRLRQRMRPRCPRQQVAHAQSRGRLAGPYI